MSESDFNFRLERINRGLTQRELAAVCEVSLTVIQRLEGGGKASPRTAKRVADYFNCEVADLMDVAA